ncbi:hypothetical protein MHBO_002034 [Bonamia ostreae]|uniref:Activator of Hsp90 ATPase homologue 1/2-like C-terminal domain-containing protein n=1 Tax=Bonamia ostreae TaxID=126728 RepID=A0ABV2AL06_9EUKA
MSKSTAYLELVFECNADDVFKAISTEEILRSFVGFGCSVDFKNGGKFSLYDGSVTGTFLSIKKNKQIVQKWRISSWPEKKSSTAKITFDGDSDGVCTVTVEHSDLPTDFSPDMAKSWWENQMFKPMSMACGFRFGED